MENNPIQHTIITPKTARYFQLGEITAKTKYVWIACHGYAQLANYFIKSFESIIDEETVVIAPEGLHRFYWEGFSGRVVASWMTKVDRESDITDYIHFLDGVTTEVLSKITHPDVKLIAFGFSQGVAAVSRWVFNSTQHQPDELILWAGIFPDDFALHNEGTFKPTKPIVVLFGDEDEFYKIHDLEALKIKLKSFPFAFDFIEYKGGHKIEALPLSQINRQIK